MTYAVNVTKCYQSDNYRNKCPRVQFIILTFKYLIIMMYQFVGFCC